jgi:hypothetical protein
VIEGWTAAPESDRGDGHGELKSNLGLNRFRKHSFMLEQACLLIVGLDHNLRTRRSVSPPEQRGAPAPNTSSKTPIR